MISSLLYCTATLFQRSVCSKWKKQISPQGGNLFPFRVDSSLERRQNSFDSVASLVSIFLPFQYATHYAGILLFLLSYIRGLGASFLFILSK